MSSSIDCAGCPGARSLLAIPNVVVVGKHVVANVDFVAVAIEALGQLPEEQQPEQALLTLGSSLGHDAAPDRFRDRHDAVRIRFNAPGRTWRGKLWRNREPPVDRALRLVPAQDVRLRRISVDFVWQIATAAAIPGAWNANH